MGRWSLAALMIAHGACGDAVPAPESQHPAPDRRPTQTGEPEPADPNADPRTPRSRKPRDATPAPADQRPSPSDRADATGSAGSRDSLPECDHRCCSAEMRRHQRQAAERLGDPTIARECCFCEPIDPATPEP